MGETSKRADRFIQRLLKKPPGQPQGQTEPAAPQSVAARLEGIHESRRKTLAIVRGLKRF